MKLQMLIKLSSWGDSCSKAFRVVFILLINVKMPTIVGILTFVNRINNYYYYFLLAVFILQINVKMPANMSIFTFMCMVYYYYYFLLDNIQMLYLSC